MTLILVFMLLLAGEKVNAQPTQTNGRAEEKQTNSQPSTTPLDNRQTNIDNAANAASPSQNQERDAKDDPFKAEQLRQNRIIAKATIYIAIFGGLSFIAALIYAIVSIKQWKAIDKQATHAGEQLTETRNLLIQDELTFRENQRQANATRNMMQGQLDAMKEQAEIMRKQAKSMDQSVVFGLRAYLGIHSVGINLETKRFYLQVENIGKVPASDIKVSVEIEVIIARGCITKEYKPSRWSGPNAVNILTVPLEYDYGKTKLFPGNLKIKIVESLSEWFTDGEISWVRQGDARMIIRGNISFEDGFNKDKNSPFALRYSARAECWLPHPILSPEEERRDEENHPYYW